MNKRIALLLFVTQAMIAADALGLRIGAPVPVSVGGALAFTNSTIDTATKRVSWVFEARDAAVVTTLLFRYGVRTGTPVQHRISIQGVTVTSGTGNPNGTVAAVGAFTPPADTTWNSTIQAVTISHDGSGNSISSLTLTKGNAYSIVIDPCPDSTAPCSGAATPDASNSSSFTSSTTSTWIDANKAGLPYADTYSGSAWSHVNDAPIWGYRSASLTYGNPLLSSTGNLISTGSEQAVNFNIPSTWWSTYKVRGVRMITAGSAASKTTVMSLYSGTTVLQSYTIDSDMIRLSGASPDTVTAYFSDATLSTLSAGTTYRIGFSPQDASNNFSLWTLDVTTAGDITAYPGQATFGTSTRASCGAACNTTSTAWTDVGTSRPMLELILEDITAPSGGGTRSYAQ